MAVDHPGMNMSLDMLVALIRRQVVATLQNSSIGQAGLRVYGGGWITIENGGLSVTGSALVSGSLQVTGTLLQIGPWSMEGDGTISGNVDGSGSLRWTGDWELQGNGEISGDVTITGALDVTGKTRLRGKTTLENDLEILAGGKIKVGDMVIDPAGAGKITFANGTEVRAGEGGVTIANGVSSVTVAPGFTRIGVGGSAVYVDGTGIFMSNVPLTAEPGLPPGTLMRRGGRIVEVG